MATVAVLGPGAVGGTFAVRFLQAGYRTLCIAPPATVQLMGLAGISFEQNGANPVVVRPEVMDRLEQPVSLLLVTVKANYLDDALERVDPEAVSSAVVLPLLNGLEHVEKLRERFDAYRVGRMQIVQKSPTALVSLASETLPARDVERTAYLLEQAGIDVEL
jgi:2-dehydropantoate 2-reductase